MPDAPSVQYARTSDGVNIAYWARGDGPGSAILHCPIGATHLAEEWLIAEPRSWYESLSRNRRVVHFDQWGTGLSDGGVSGFSLDAAARVIEAVADHAGLQRFALLAGWRQGLPAIAFAARHPERVTHLILFSAAAKFEDLYGSPRADALRRMRGADWTVYTEGIAHFLIGGSAGESWRPYASMLRAAYSEEAYATLTQAMADWDCTDLLPVVEPPTLVLQRRDAPPLPAAATTLASAIPSARLILLDGDSIVPFFGDSGTVARSIDEFLASGNDEGRSSAPTSGFQTILFTDLESSTALTQRLGDEGAQELLRGHNDAVRAALEAHDGREVKHTGDGIMASFPSAVSAVQAALAMQHDLAGGEVRVRIGLNAGEPIAEDDDLFGIAVIKASRICDRAEPGQVLVSDVVRQLCEGKGFEFTSIGDATLKGFDEPVALYEVRAQT